MTDSTGDGRRRTATLALCRTAATDLAEAKRRRRESALNARRAGATFVQIGEALGLTPAAVHKLVNTGGDA